jgi:hypothetical protein
MSSWTACPLKMRPTGCPETSVTTNIRSVTSQKSENLNKITFSSFSPLLILNWSTFSVTKAFYKLELNQHDIGRLREWMLLYWRSSFTTCKCHVDTRTQKTWQQTLQTTVCVAEHFNPHIGLLKVNLWRRVCCTLKGRLEWIYSIRKSESTASLCKVRGSQGWDRNSVQDI